MEQGFFSYSFSASCFHRGAFDNEPLVKAINQDQEVSSQLRCAHLGDALEKPTNSIGVTGRYGLSCKS